jgi:hypothetical protein
VQDINTAKSETHDVSVGLIFFFSILGSICLIEFFTLAWSVLWIDIFNTNPHRTIEHALSLPFLTTPLTVLFLLFGRLGFALIAVTIIAKVLFRKKGRLSAFDLSILIGTSILFIVIQDITIPTYNFMMESDGNVLIKKDLFRMTKWSASYFLPGVILAWFLVRRHFAKSSH